jgi:hypothetical protein
MLRLTGYPRWCHGALLGTLTALTASGMWLLPGMLEMRLDWSIGWHAEGAPRVLGSAIHTGAAFMTLGAFGALLAIHARIGWRRRLNRLSGSGLVVACSIMLGSSLITLYAGDESWSRGGSIAHTGAALLGILLFAWHGLVGRALRRSARRGRAPANGCGAASGKHAMTG